jgi:hypothetical protein
LKMWGGTKSSQVDKRWSWQDGANKEDNSSRVQHFIFLTWWRIRYFRAYNIGESIGRKLDSHTHSWDRSFTYTFYWNYCGPTW